MKVETIMLAGDRSVRVYRSGKNAGTHAGTNTGAPLVWLHGLPGIRASDPVIAALGQNREVIAPLAPGFADADELDDIRDERDLALHYDDLFEALDLDGIDLVGHSFGAMVAAEVAAHVPKRVRSLTLISPLGMWRDDDPAPDMFARPAAAMDQILWKDGAASAAMMDPADEPADPVEKAVAAAQALTAVAKFLWPLPDRGLRRRLHRITAKTLVIRGADDVLVPASYAEDLVAGISGAMRMTVPGAAHMVAYEALADVAARIERHLTEIVLAA